MLLSSTAVLNSFRRATCTLQLTDRAKERKTAVAIFLETKSDLTKAICIGHLTSFSFNERHGLLFEHDPLGVQRGHAIFQQFEPTLNGLK